MKLFLDIGEILLATVGYCVIGGLVYKLCNEIMDFEKPFDEICGAFWPISLLAGLMCFVGFCCGYALWKCILTPGMKIGHWIWDFVGGFIEGLRA